MTQRTAKGKKPSFWLSATRAQGRDTGMAMVLICLIIAKAGQKPGFVSLAIVILLLDMIWPSFYKPFAKIWFGFSHILGTVMSKIILGLTFFLVLTPMGLLRKVSGKDPMKIKHWKNGAESVFRVRDHTFDAGDIEQPF